MVASGERAKAAKAKRWPDPITIPSDDCELDFGGEVYRPHAGETVTIRPGLTVGALQLVNRLSLLQPQMAGLDTESTLEQRLEVTKRFSEIVDEIAKVVAPRILEWTWTDEGGERLPAPSFQPSVLDRIEIKELMYLVLALQGEGKAGDSKG